MLVDLLKIICTKKTWIRTNLFFNVRNSSNGNILINEGSESRHLSLMVTTKKLLTNLDSNLPGCYHIDATYKLVKNGFPLLVFARTDAEHKIHPIAFCLSSHEQEKDFSEFYTGLINLADDLCVELDPEYIVQDACDASYNAAKYAVTQRECLGLYYYLKKSWLTGRFRYWQVYNKPLGLDSTNSPLQSLNRMAKYYSVRQQNFATIPVPDSKAKKYGKIFSIQKYFKRIDKESWKFNDSTSYFRLQILKFYYKQGVCGHLIGLNKLVSKDEFVRKAKREKMKNYMYNVYSNKNSNEKFTRYIFITFCLDFKNMSVKPSTRS
ncbi:unnamed protein product [Brachionus calyciflorus]|uniref:MULE transposase domain-containing protein n=1 Tax=Brachionus calyciflorus TaxID=104777 RepID=A0A814PX42_9BILA|nr:unnamed protein product [Brachionus calyciflorus]